MTMCSVMLFFAQIWFLRVEKKRAECFHSFHPVVSELTVLPQQAAKWKGMQWTGLMQAAEKNHNNIGVLGAFQVMVQVEEQQQPPLHLTNHSYIKHVTKKRFEGMITKGARKYFYFYSAVKKRRECVGLKATPLTF